LQECRQTETGVETPANKRAGAEATPYLKESPSPDYGRVARNPPRIDAKCEISSNKPTHQDM
jgi:hypothetical protein